MKITRSNQLFQNKQVVILKNNLRECDGGFVQPIPSILNMGGLLSIGGFVNRIAYLCI